MADTAGAPAAPVALVRGSTLAWAHTWTVLLAFFGSLAIGWQLHYTKIVKNEYFGYPQEWFPSISATIGDYYPERTFFQYFMAAASGPRFFLIFGTYFLARFREGGIARPLNRVLLAVGILRTFAAGAWTYVTSSEDHALHDIGMIAYILFSVIYHFGLAVQTSRAGRKLQAPHVARTGFLRLRFAQMFVLMMIPLVYLFIRHKVDKVPGAYSYYAYVEWSLIIFDVGYDALSALDFKDLTVQFTAPASELVVKDPAVAAVASSLPSTASFAAEMFAFLVDTFLGFLSWSYLTALATMIWFFPLFNMGLSGEEAAVAGAISPILFVIPGFRRLCVRHIGFLHLLSLVGIAAYLRPDPAQRLVIGGVACFINMLAVTAPWWESGEKRNRAIMTNQLGLILSLVVRVYCRTTNPVWPIMRPENGGFNPEALVAGFVCSVIVMLRGSSGAPPAETQAAPVVDKSKVAKLFGSILSGFFYGSLLFTTQFLFTDTSTVPRQTVVGYPDTGPLPFPHGLAIVPVASLGLYLGFTQPFTATLTWWAIGSAGGLALCYGFGFPAFVGGLVLCAFVFSSWPHAARAAGRSNAFISMLVGFVTYCALLFFEVYVVAYAFVPGGVYFRERTDALYITMLLLLGTGVAVMGKPSAPHPRELRHLAGVLLLLNVLLVGAGLSRVQPTPNHPVRMVDGHKTITGAIWTIHFGYDNQMWASHHRMAALIRDVEADVIGLLESDTERPFIGNRDVPLMVAEELNYYLDYGPSPRNHTWGCAMLSKFPIVRSQHYLLPSPEGELACAIHATLDLDGTHVDVLVAHNGQEETPLDRELQTKLEGEILSTATNPIFFIGYVITKPTMPNYQWLLANGAVKDIDPTDQKRWCEYIVYRNLIRAGYARISHGGITDTEMQVGRFIVPEDTNNFVDNDKIIDESQVPEVLRFPKVFMGKGIRGHRHEPELGFKPRYFGH